MAITAGKDQHWPTKSGVRAGVEPQEMVCVCGVACVMIKWHPPGYTERSGIYAGN